MTEMGGHRMSRGRRKPLSQPPPLDAGQLERVVLNPMVHPWCRVAGTAAIVTDPALTG
jgi:hypothetical protein